MGGWLLAAEAREKRALFPSAVFPSIRSPGAGRPSAPCTRPYPPSGAAFRPAVSPHGAASHPPRRPKPATTPTAAEKSPQGTDKKSGDNPVAHPAHPSIRRLWYKVFCSKNSFGAFRPSRCPAGGGTSPRGSPRTGVSHPGPAAFLFAHRKGLDEPEKKRLDSRNRFFHRGRAYRYRARFAFFYRGRSARNRLRGAVRRRPRLGACSLHPPPPFRAPASKERGPPCAGRSARRPSRMRGTPKG